MSPGVYDNRRLHVESNLINYLNVLPKVPGTLMSQTANLTGKQRLWIRTLTERSEVPDEQKRSRWIPWMISSLSSAGSWRDS